MTRLLVTAAALALAASVSAQQPTVQNGRVETRQATAVDRELSALGAGPDAVWVGWRAPMVDGDPNVCSTWSDSRYFSRGESLEPRPMGADQPAFPAPSGPVRLEGNTNVVILARMIGGTLERLRVIGDDCPIDAGGKTVYMLNGITPAESARYLETLTRLEALNVSANRRLAESAVTAIGLQRDQAATAALDRLSAAGVDRSLRRQAVSALARTRGAHGYEVVTALIKTERDRDTRQGFVSALAESNQPQVPDALL